MGSPNDEGAKEREGVRLGASDGPREGESVGAEEAVGAAVVGGGVSSQN